MWLLGGGSGHGFKHGPAIAERVAAALAGGAPLPRAASACATAARAARCAPLARRCAAA